MAARRAYLDYNASAPLLAEARKAMLAALDFAANPSSVHVEGRAVRQIVEEARGHVARLVNGRAEHVIFTSGATEAAATLLSPDWVMGRAPLRFSRLYVSAADHPCLLGGGRFAPDSVTQIGVDANGLLNLDELRAALAGHDKQAGLPLVAVHHVNNETGIIQPIAEIGRVAKDAGAVFIADAVQSVGRINVDITDGSVDYFILSSHKIGGPKGVGAIVSAADLMMPKPLVTGGGQEKGHRAGTENVAAIAGFGAAARQASASLDAVKSIRARRDDIEYRIRELICDAVIYGESVPRVANTSFFGIPGMKAETAQIAFDLAGVALSAGSACSSGRVGPSHVLQAMGYGDQAGALRVSIGPGTDDADIEIFVRALQGIAKRRRVKNAAA